MVEGTGLIIRFPMERRWFEPSRMHFKIFVYCFFSNREIYIYTLYISILKNDMVKLNSREIIDNLQDKFLKREIPNIQIGDNVKIGVKIIEGDRERIQFYEGTVIVKKNSSINKTITVRKVLQGIGIERIFLIHSPKVDSIQILRSSKVRRAKLYYLRNLRGKASRLKQQFR